MSERKNGCSHPHPLNFRSAQHNQQQTPLADSDCLLLDFVGERLGDLFKTKIENLQTISGGEFSNGGKLQDIGVCKSALNIVVHSVSRIPSKAPKKSGKRAEDEKILEQPKTMVDNFRDSMVIGGGGAGGGGRGGRGGGGGGGEAHVSTSAVGGDIYKKGHVVKSKEMIYVRACIIHGVDPIVSPWISECHEVLSESVNPANNLRGGGEGEGLLSTPHKKSSRQWSNFDVELDRDPLRAVFREARGTFDINMR